MSSPTRVNYLDVNGKRYYTGTVFMIDFHGKIQEAAFVCSMPELKKMRFKLLSDKKFWFISVDGFRNMIVEITDKVDPSVRMPVTKTMKDKDIDGLFIGWLWYIFLMVISSIFKDAIGLWIFISVVFFTWRKKKIQEEGTYTEW